MWAIQHNRAYTKHIVCVLAPRATTPVPQYTMYLFLCVFCEQHLSVQKSADKPHSHKVCNFDANSDTHTRQQNSWCEQMRALVLRRTNDVYICIAPQIIYKRNVHDDGHADDDACWRLRAMCRTESQAKSHLNSHCPSDWAQQHTCRVNRMTKFAGRQLDICLCASLKVRWFGLVCI